MSFETLGLGPKLLQTVADAGYVTATPIQHSAIPHILGGRDLTIPLADYAAVAGRAGRPPDLVAARYNPPKGLDNATSFVGDSGCPYALSRYGSDARAST